MLVFIFQLAMIFRTIHGLGSGAVVCTTLPTSLYMNSMIAFTRTDAIGENSSFVLGMDRNSYVPGQANTIWVNRTKGNMTLGFRGLMLYVLNGSNVKIGTWNLTTPANIKNAVCAVNGDTLTHDTSTLEDNTFAKDQFFIWNAPASITGSVQINAVAYETVAKVFNVPVAVTVNRRTSPPTSAPVIPTTTGLLTTVTETTSTTATSATARDSTTTQKASTTASESTTTAVETTTSTSTLSTTKLMTTSLKKSNTTTTVTSTMRATTTTTGSMSTKVSVKTSNINSARSFVFVTAVVQICVALLLFV